MPSNRHKNHTVTTTPRSVYLSTSQVAETIGISTKTVYRWVNEGRLRAYKPTARSMRFRSDEVQLYLESTLVPTVGTIGEAA